MARLRLHFMPFRCSFRLLRWIFTAPGLLIAVNLLQAQATATAPEPTISVKFRVIVWQSGQPAAFNYSSGVKSILVKDLNTALRSGFYDYVGPATLVLYPPVPKASTTAKPTTPDTPILPLARITIPTAIKYPLIVLVPNPAGPLPYRGIVFDDDPENFPFGTYLFQNYSSRKIAAEMSGNRFLLESAASHLVTNAEESLHLRMAVSVEIHSKWKMIYDDYYPNWSSNRTVIFLVDELREGRVHVGIRTLLENQAVWDAAQKKKL
jgi:hypothetical protein